MSMTSARRALRHLPLMAAFLAAGELSAKTKPLPEEPKTAPPAPTVSAAEAANKQAIMDALLIPVRHVFMLACGDPTTGEPSTSTFIASPATVIATNAGLVVRGVNNRTVRDDSVACNFISLDKVYDPAAKTMELSPWKGTVDITCTSGDKTVKVEAHGNEITYVKDGRVFFDLTPDAESANDFTVPRNSVCILTPGLAEPAAPEAPPVQKTIKI